MMAHYWKAVRKQQTPQIEAEGKAWVSAQIAAMPLAELRRARALTQAQIAELLEMDQGSVSKIERRTDMYLRTLRTYIEAMGGELHLVATFPDGQIEIDRLGDQPAA